MKFDVAKTFTEEDLWSNKIQETERLTIECLKNMKPIEEKSSFDIPIVRYMGITGFGMILTGWWVLLPRYCIWRHRKYPYTEKQLGIRRDWFGNEFPIDISPVQHRFAVRAFQGTLIFGIIQGFMNKVQ